MTSDIAVKFGEVVEKPTIFPEEKGKINVVLTNQGNASVNGPVDLQLYASTDKVLDINDLNTLGTSRGADDPLKGTDELLGTLKNQNVTLVPGESKTITVDFAGQDFRTPSVVSAGGYNLFAQIQPGAAVGDTNNNNNTANLLITTGDAVIQWNSILLNAIQEKGKGAANGDPPPLSARNQAIVHAAIYDAVNAIDRGHKAYLVNIGAGEAAGASQEAAAVEAAYKTLISLYPEQKGTFDEERTRSLGAIPDGVAKNKGIAIGDKVASEILAKRQNDGSANASGGYTPGNDPGDFQLIPTEFQPNPPSVNPGVPQWGKVTPFGIGSVANFRPEGPPEFSSPLYGRQIEETRKLGGKRDTDVTKLTRTADQAEIAQFWAYDRDDTFRPAGQLNQVAQEIALSKGNSLADNARLFALLNFAEADASIVAWDAKYTYEQLRPITAIRNAGNDDNPLTVQDSNWESLIGTPNFPDYVSGHSVFAGAATKVLERFYGTDNIKFDIPSQELPGVARSYNSLSQAAREDAVSRVYGGVHNDLATVDGVAIGQNVANNIVDNLLI